MVFAFTNDDADAGVFVLFSDALVEERKVKTHFSGVFWLEFSDFQINGNQRLQAPVEEEQINPVFFPVQIERKLVGDKAKIAAHFHQKLAYVLKDCLFKLVLGMLFAEFQEIEGLVVLDRKNSLGLQVFRQILLEILLADHRFFIGLVLDLMNQDVFRPPKTAGLVNIK